MAGTGAKGPLTPAGVTRRCGAKGSL